MAENEIKSVSTTELARRLQIDSKKLFETLMENEWIGKKNNKYILLPKGNQYGGKYQSNEKGERWVVWPDNIETNKRFKDDILKDFMSAKRKFKLPGINDLNKDQDKVLRLPEKGKFLVVGGPGTGKSVVALLRALKYHENNDYVFLTYNHVLNTFTKQLVDINLKSFTTLQWFYKLQFKLTRQFMPEIEDYEPDYDEVITKFEDLELPPRSICIIIDEAQDMPPKFYESLLLLNISNFFIVADQNQQITEHNSSRQDLTVFLGINNEDVVELEHNYRNSHPIAFFAQHFYTDKASPLPKLPPKEEKPLDTPILYEYDHHEQCVEIILLEADKDNRKLIGVITATSELRDKLEMALLGLDVKLSNAKPIISSYSREQKQSVNINFSNGGIVVLSDKSVKGIEFDVVYIIIDDYDLNGNDHDVMKKRLYVMSSRAKEKLILFKRNNYSGRIEEILPDDESILRREKL